MSELSDLRERLQDLESKFMFQQETVDSLNEMVTDQWSIIDKLKGKLKDMDDQLYAIENHQGSTPTNQPPPHY